MKTIPVVTPMGIREMSEEQAESYGRSRMTDRERLVELERTLLQLGPVLLQLIEQVNALELRVRHLQEGTEP